MDDKYLKEKRNNVLIMFMLFPLIAIFVVVTVPLFYNGFIRFKESYKIISYVFVNDNELKKYINGELEKLQLNDAIDIIDTPYCNEETCFVKFEVDSYGIGSNSCYTGFYYSEDDIIHKFEYDDREISKIGFNIYVIEETNGDNTMYLKKIKKHWYYYESCY